MYNVAVSVQACLRAGTRVDVAWPVASDEFTVDPASDAVALTPGGGRIGGVLGGVADSQLSDLAQQGLSRGRLVEVSVTDAEAALAGHPRGGTLRCALVPAALLPERLWPLLVDRTPVCLVAPFDGDDLDEVAVYTGDDIDTAGDEIATAFQDDTTKVALIGSSLVTSLRPVPRLIVFGAGPIASALDPAARLLGWHVVVEADVRTAIGLMASLSPIDSAVITGHDVEASSRVLAAAIEGHAGYIGSVGSLTMQDQRADWLAYRGIDDLRRVSGPAGVDIGARSPAEIAVSILAEAIAAQVDG